MFLSELKPEQKELFLDLGIYLSLSDGNFVDSEKNMICQMCKEMEIGKRMVANLSFEEALDKIKNGATIRERRIILLETAGIVLADGVYTAEEERVTKKISDSLGIDFSQYKEAVETIKELKNVYSKIGTFLTNK